MPGRGYKVRVTLVRGRCLVVEVSPASSRSSGPDRVCGGILVSEVAEDDPDVSGVEEPGVSVGSPFSVVTGGLVLVIVWVVVVVEVGDVEPKVGSTKSIGAFWGWSALLVSATTPQTTSTITERAATLAPRTAGVD